MPTEAEWEYAARQGSVLQTNKYSGSNDISKVAWYKQNSGGKTSPVGQKLPNSLGVYDMSGNVWEWCSDKYGRYPSYFQRNPKGIGYDKNRVLRGGGWSDEKELCIISMRRSSPSNESRYNIGFRLAMDKK